MNKLLIKRNIKEDAGLGEPQWFQSLLRHESGDLEPFLRKSTSITCGIAWPERVEDQQANLVVEKKRKKLSLS